MRPITVQEKVELNRDNDHSAKKPLIGLTVLGFIPALIILGFLRLQEGQLIIAGQAIGEYSLPRLTAGLWSIMTPLFLLTPPALAFSQKPTQSVFWVLPPCVPLILTGPSLIAGWIVGGEAPWQIGPALFFLGLMILCWVLWLAVLNTLVDFKLSILIYGSLWAASGFIGYLHEYVAPNMDLGISGLVSVLYWMLPQLQNGFGILDNYLANGELQLYEFGPSMAQAVILAGGLLFFPKKHSESQTDA